MKKIYFLLFAVMAAHNAIAQNISDEIVPQPVSTSFKNKFPASKGSSWAMDYDKYEVDFKIGKNDYSAKFDKNGSWLETKSYLKPSKLPKLIKESLSKKYGELSAYKIKEAEMTENGKEITYNLEVEKGTSVFELELDDQGEILKENRKSEIKVDY